MSFYDLDYYVKVIFDALNAKKPYRVNAALWNAYNHDNVLSQEEYKFWLY